MRTSVFSVGGSPSYGSRCRKSVIGIADCHSGSSRVPSSLGGCSIAVACAFRFDCSTFGTCPESGDKKQRYRTIRNRVASAGLAHGFIVSPFNAMASGAHYVKDERYLCGHQVADQDLASVYPKNSVRSVLSSTNHNGPLVLHALPVPMLLRSGCGACRLFCWLSIIQPHVFLALSNRGPSATATRARGCGTFNKRQLETDCSLRPVENSAALPDSETVTSVSCAVSPSPSALPYASFLVQPFRNADTGSEANSSSRRSTSENTRRASDSTSCIGRRSSMSTPMAASPASAMTASPPLCARLNSTCPRAPSTVGVPFLRYENRIAAGEQPSRSASTRPKAARPTKEPARGRSEPK